MRPQITLGRITPSGGATSAVQEVVTDWVLLLVLGGLPSWVPSHLPGPTSCE